MRDVLPYGTKCLYKEKLCTVIHCLDGQLYGIFIKDVAYPHLAFREELIVLDEISNHRVYIHLLKQ